MFGDIFSTRRSFLTRGLTLVGAGVTVPAFIERSAAALAAPAGTRAARGGGDQRVLVVVQLAGGNDGLNTVVPTTNDLYFKRRPTLAIAKGQALKLTDDAGLHPSLKGLKALYDAGSLAVVQGVGYPNPNRSHFQSTDIWSTASPDGKLHTGWIGRYFDAQCKGQDPPNPKAGVSLTAEMPLAMLGQKFAPVAFQKPESLSWNEGKKRPIRRGMVGDNPQQAAFERLNQPERKGRGEVSELDYLQRTALDARISAADIQTAARGSAAVNYPNTPLASSLRTVARMIAANMPTRIYYLQQGGFDTHTGQQNRHPQLLSQLGDAIKAFCDDLRASKQFDRVTLMTFSEFGRRVEENASGGTDHGTAAPLFIAGGQVKAGILGAAPSLEKLDAGDLIYTTDFRGVYASMLKDWLGADAGKLLGGQFSPLPIFQRT